MLTEPQRALLSPVARSNLFTMGAAARKDPRQMIPRVYTIPSVEVRVLRARLIMEEAIETCLAMGIEVRARYKDSDKFFESKDDLLFSPAAGLSAFQLDIGNIIDGCCDTIYVCVGTMCALGAPDVPHLEEVCIRNNAKFPDGVAITDENGKFQKPEGWEPPDHDAIITKTTVDLFDASERLVAEQATA